MIATLMRPHAADEPWSEWEHGPEEVRAVRKAVARRDRRPKHRIRQPRHRHLRWIIWANIVVMIILIVAAVCMMLIQGRTTPTPHPRPITPTTVPVTVPTQYQPAPPSTLV